MITPAELKRLTDSLVEDDRTTFISFLKFFSTSGECSFSEYPGTFHELTYHIEYGNMETLTPEIFKKYCNDKNLHSFPPKALIVKITLKGLRKLYSLMGLSGLWHDHSSYARLGL